MDKLISVIIINYNTFELTKKCIESVIAQSEGIALEIIVVDNGSVEVNPMQFLTCFPDIKLVKSEKNIGFAKGNNLGIMHATGDFVVLLNSDTVLLNNAIEQLASFLECNRKAGLVSAQLTNPDGSIQYSANTFPSIGKELYLLLRLKWILPRLLNEKILGGKLVSQSRETATGWVWGTCICFRRELLQFFPNGRLHDDFFMYFEDVQWCFFIRKVLNLKIYYLPTAKLLHYGGASGLDTDFVSKYITRILPNQYKWMVSEKGKLYAKVYLQIIYVKHLLNPGLFSKYMAHGIKNFRKRDHAIF